MGDSNRGRQSWIQEPSGSAGLQVPGEAEASCPVQPSSSTQAAEFVTMSPASFVQAANRVSNRYADENSLHGGYAADSYNGIQRSQSLAVAGTSHVYQDAESSYDNPQQSYSNLASNADMTSNNEAAAQMLHENYNSIVSSNSVNQASNPGVLAVNQLVTERGIPAPQVMSPDGVDSTVSQSEGNYDQRIANEFLRRVIGHQLPQRTTVSYVNMPNASMTYSQSEVSTSGEHAIIMLRGQLHGDEVADGHGEADIIQGQAHGSRGSTDDIEAVSSLSESGPNEAEVNVRVSLKVERPHLMDDIECGEPDTTQTEDEEYIIEANQYSSEEEEEAAQAIHLPIQASHTQASHSQASHTQASHTQASHTQATNSANLHTTTANQAQASNALILEQGRVFQPDNGDNLILQGNQLDASNGLILEHDSDDQPSIMIETDETGVAMLQRAAANEGVVEHMATANPNIDSAMQQHLNVNELMDQNLMVRYTMPNAQQLTAEAQQIAAATNQPVGFVPVLPSSLINGQQIQVEQPHHLLANGMTLSQLSANQMPSSSQDQQSSAGQAIYTVQQQENSSGVAQIIVNKDFVGELRKFMHAGDGSNIHITTSTLQAPDASTTAKPSTSRVSRRKSNRIADIAKKTTAWNKPKFNPSPYDPNHLWCEECMASYEIECRIHKLTPVADKIVFSRAWASLPIQLQIFRIGDEENVENAELGVFAKKPIARQTQFGPFVADLVQSRDLLTRHSFPLMVEQPSGEVTFFETSDENKCNWMMFVRAANNVAEQNLVAYQYGQDIFFTSVKPIEAKDELKVWYAAHYAERWNQPVFEATEQDIQEMEDKACKYQCYDCPKKFKTASALQKHLIFHEIGGIKVEDSEPSSSKEAGSSPCPNKRKPQHVHNTLRKKIMAKKAKENSQSVESIGSSVGTYHWKKRSTNIYLNKTLKKYQKRHDVEVMRKSIQHHHLYNQQKVEGSDEDIACYQCDLVFDNYSLHSIHILSHYTEENKANADLSQFVRPLDTFQANSGTPTTDGLVLGCPVCPQQFYQKNLLIEHVRYHARNHIARLQARQNKLNPKKPNRCRTCSKCFSTPERLTNHSLVHATDQDKPVQCNVCLKRFMNNSALACHIKTHSNGKYYQCPICEMGFDHTLAMREHSFIHANQQGTFNCPHCDKIFVEFLVLKKHMRGFHTNQTFTCPDCDRTFPRMDKLRLHQLRHSSLKEFMCDTCGRQFKRKDKLKEHIKRMHSLEREERDRMKALKPPSRRFIPKVAPTEYHRFIYKCHLCLLGFKRRGMLVNHIAKRHPDIKPDSVPELNLPILKTQRDYYCQYCDKVYKSSSKRKAHILKNHPGSELPQSARKKISVDEIPGIPNPTYSQTVGSVTTMPHQCEYCHKQYASKAKLLQHQRKKHPNCAQAQVSKLLSVDHMHTVQSEEGISVEAYDAEASQAHDTAQATDLLTQAMSELTQSVEFRQVSATHGADGAGAYLTARLSQGIQGTPAMVQIQQTSGATGASTIELTNLNQALQQFAPPQSHLPIQVQVSAGAQNPIQIPILTSHAGGGSAPAATQILAVDGQIQADADSPQQQVASSQPQQITFSPISIVGGTTYIPKTWTNYTYKSH